MRNSRKGLDGKNGDHVRRALAIDMCPLGPFLPDGRPQKTQACGEALPLISISLLLEEENSLIRGPHFHKPHEKMIILLSYRSFKPIRKPAVCHHGLLGDRSQVIPST
jgi:hypothetical protein